MAFVSYADQNMVHHRRAQVTLECFESLIEVFASLDSGEHAWTDSFHMQSGWREPNVKINYETGKVTWL